MSPGKFNSIDPDSIDPLLLQRLIDGQLNSASISELVDRAEQNPGLWRDIGSSFIEDRIFRDAFCDYADEPDSKTAQPETGITPALLSADTDQPTGSRDTVDSNRRNRSGAGWPVLAATMLIALTGGLLGGRYWQSQSGSSLGEVSHAGTGHSQTSDGSVQPEVDSDLDQEPATGTADENYSPEQPGFTLVNNPDYRLDLVDASGQPMLGGEVPLYTVQNARQMNYRVDDNQIPDQLLARAADRGYQCDQQIHYVSGTLADGREFIVPIRTLNISSGR